MTAPSGAQRAQDTSRHKALELLTSLHRYTVTDADVERVAAALDAAEQGGRDLCECSEQARELIADNESLRARVRQVEEALRHAASLITNDGRSWSSDPDGPAGILIEVGFVVNAALAEPR